MNECATMMKLLYPHLDGELDMRDSTRVQIHLQECSSCRETVATEARFRDFARLTVADRIREISSQAKACKP